jgi:hypothetical protein
MKKIISYAVAVLIISSVAAAPGSRLIEKFNATFPNAKNVKWSDDKSGYFVSFYQNENFEKVLYSREGDFICSWKYSNGEDLPTNIVLTLNRKYGESKILGVTELTTPTNVSYDIKISKGSKWYCLDILSDGTITKEEKYNQDANNDAAER